MRPVIMLFAKAPRPGHVKTRLLGRLNPADAATLHQAFTLDMLNTLVSLEGVDVELHTDIATDVWEAANVSQHLQSAGDLGARMYQALSSRIAAGRPLAMVAGSDAPDLPVSHLTAMLAIEADVVLGPSEDGGYWSIACRRTHPAMFRGVVWSQETTLEETLDACGACGLSTALGPVWRDVDEWRDLLRLRESLDLPAHTRQWLEGAEVLLDQVE